MITLRRLGFATALALAVTAAPSTPVGAAPTAVSGNFVFDHAGICDDAPGGFDEFTFVISGDLEGCWYTNVGPSLNLGPPSGLYLESGHEVFVGQIRGGLPGTFSTSYTFESRWDPSFPTGTEIWGRCEHLIVRGSGTEALGGVSGYVLRTDTAPDGLAGRYRGSVRLP